MTPRQLTFSLPVGAKLTAEDFMPAPANAAALRLVDAWPEWPSRGLLLVGPPGSGKTHLATIWADMANARLMDAVSLDEDAISAMGDTPLVVENIDVPGCSETALFHFMNAAREARIPFILSSSQPPNADWPKLPDLASRLRQLTLAELQPPDDVLVKAVLVKLFDDRQLAVDAEVVDYISRRMERSLGAAREIVAALDEEALALGRRVTKPVAATVLSRLTSEVD